MNEEWESLHKGWLGRRMPGSGCPWGCHALPEQEKKGGGGMWFGARELTKALEE
jgi:hypothetical protein